MENTLKKAKDLRPKAKWGYYGFPYCYNAYNIKEKKSASCVTEINKENPQ